MKKIQQYSKSYFLQPGPHMAIISILLQLKGIGVACNLKKGHKELSFFLLKGNFGKRRERSMANFINLC